VSAGLHVLAEGDIPARVQMGASLGFHIVFACFGIAFPAVFLIAEWIGIRRGDQVALVLAERWSKVAAVIFAVGAVSGTVLSYELGLLWPVLMGTYGAAFGIPFAIEGIWFFVEAIFTGVYLYGWRRLSPWLHWWSGVPTLVAGLFGALSVVAANSWMNAPGGFTMENGRITAVDPWAVIFNAATPYQTPHMILAAYLVVGFTVAGVYAVGLLRGRRDRYHRLGFLIPFWVGAVCAPLQVLMGDILTRWVANEQPIKFAALALVDDTQRGTTEWIGGIYWNGEIYFGIGIPYLNSLLVGFSPDTEVIGWNSVPPDLRPPLPNLLHWAFDIMVGIGFALMALGAWQAWVWRFRREVLATKWFLVPAALAGAGAIVAMESGWIVTEVGRQPWVVYGLLRTRDAVTTAGGVPVTLAVTIVLYGVLTATSIVVPWLMGRRWRAQGVRTPADDVVQPPYGPPPRQVEETRT
jgi:cytochrome bd ubiquinol oxidase subunit I